MADDDSSRPEAQRAAEKEQERGWEWLTLDAAPAKPPATSGIGRRRLVWVLVLVWLGGMIRDGVGAAAGGRADEATRRSG